MPSSKNDITEPKLLPGLSTEPDIPQWAYLGQPGQKQTERTTRNSWRNVKPFKSPTAVDWVVPIPTQEALARMMHGFCPEEMEDKWVIFAEGPAAEGGEGGTTATICFHRSWTGIGGRGGESGAVASRGGWGGMDGEDCERRV